MLSGKGVENEVLEREFARGAIFLRIVQDRQDLLALRGIHVSCKVLDAFETNDDLVVQLFFAEKPSHPVETLHVLQFGHALVHDQVINLLCVALVVDLATGPSSNVPDLDGETTHPDTGCGLGSGEPACERTEAMHVEPSGEQRLAPTSATMPGVLLIITVPEILKVWVPEEGVTLKPKAPKIEPHKNGKLADQYDKPKDKDGEKKSKGTEEDEVSDSDKKLKEVKSGDEKDALVGINVNTGLNGLGSAHTRAASNIGGDDYSRRILDNDNDGAVQLDEIGEELRVRADRASPPSSKQQAQKKEERERT
eukprot:CAMPEP_0167810784 /NCGR_PEP_ID=MMETSP0112_2-20121227/282_1 /TAXON_ID=91324 /ORGANISM="Lotharella globosa, Strain CCCM811" /LENGTH=308 /DNA_ID=CAMNT_0007709377 /DNA_START=264 /DNA_END=1187 /DNA_ORIENTATION=-